MILKRLNLLLLFFWEGGGHINFESVEGGGEGLEQKSLDYFSVSKVALSSLSAFEKIVDIDATGECVFYSSQFEKIGL